MDCNHPQSRPAIETLVAELDVLIRARYPLIAVSTFEELRFRRVLQAVAQLERHAPKGLFLWSRTQGLRQTGGPEDRVLPGFEDPMSILEHIAQAERGLYLLADYGEYLCPFGQADPQLVRTLRELAWTIKTRPVTVLFVGPSFPDIPSLEKEVKRIDLDLPDEAEVEAMLNVQLGRLADNPDIRLQVDGETREHLVQALLGLTETEIENALAKAAITFRGVGPDAIPLILEEKRAVIRQSGALTYSHPEPADHLGGYANLRKLLQEAAVTFTPAARAYGVEPMKGLLLVGLPGTGKDLTKKIAASLLGRPLLDLDFGAEMGEGGGVIGSAAASIRRALSIASTLKGLLGISEFEKAVSGLQSSDRSDGGETARTIATLLNWMQEQQDVFVIATANDVRQLAPEQLRQGRFSQVVFVDLPTPEDRAEIFAVHLRKRDRDPEAFNLEELAAAADGFSGAEIEGAVKGALLDAFMDGSREITTADVVRRVKSIRPTSEVKREDIEELRRWAKDHLAIDAVRGPAEGAGRFMEF
ncbi:MAG TPA: AAA family ATPase [Chloroflexota bacterium]|nr:AAA family ATPase [Chloroflexota bacterium]